MGLLYRSAHHLASSVLMVCCLLQLTVAADVNPVRRVLILNEVGTSYPLINLVDDGIRATLASSPFQIELYREYMDTTLFPDPADQKQIRDFYIRKHQNRKPDVIVTVGSSPLRFMAETHNTSFPGVPIVFCFPNTPAEKIPLDPNFTGIGSDLAPAATIDAALRLLPDTRHIVVVGGVSPYDRREQAFVKGQLRKFEDRLDISYLVDLPTPALLVRLRHLQSHTLVLLTAFGRDSDGTAYNADQSAPMIVSAANAPVFSLVDRYLGHGEVGGDISSAIGDGKIVGAIVVRLLSGEKPADIPTVKSGAAYAFDWRALKRWGLKEKNLPPGSIVLNRKLSFWEAYRWYVAGGLLVFIAQSVAILGLLWQRARRRKAETRLRRSEEMFSKSFRQSPLVKMMTRMSDGQCIDVNDSFESQTGWTRDEVIGRTLSDIHLWVDPDQRSVFMKELLATGSLRDFEAQLRRKDGQTWTGLVSAAVIDLTSEQCILSAIADISERKEAENVLSTVSQRLIEAQEEERTRIARELHDDIGQRIVIVGVNLETLKRDVATAKFNARRRFQEVCQSVSDLVSDIQSLSHRLHSSKLEYFGLEVASASFCRELSGQKEVKINFSSEGVPKMLPFEVSLCLFRVLQEALNNAVKYSGVREFDVSLMGTSKEIQLTVRDSGIGFDLSAATRGYGLGLTSMSERMKLVDGYLSISSKPQRGTTVLARVPLKAGTENAGAVA